MTAKLWKVDTSNSEASFSIKKLGLLTINGTLSSLTGAIHFSEDDLGASAFDVCVSTNTIDTGSAKRDEHLKNADFFAVEQYPTICFKSTAIEKTATGYQATGNLIMLGTTKEISIPFTFQQGTFTGSFSINRMDYQLGSKFPAFIVGKTVQITIACKVA
ncbi:MAG: YceI family protein [Bacteroidota bacterium]